MCQEIKNVQLRKEEITINNKERYISTRKSQAKYQWHIHWLTSYMQWEEAERLITKAPHTAAQNGRALKEPLGEHYLVLLRKLIRLRKSLLMNFANTISILSPTIQEPDPRYESVGRLLYEHEIVPLSVLDPGDLSTLYQTVAEGDVALAVEVQKTIQLMKGNI